MAAKTENLSLRLDEELQARLDRLAVELTKRAEGAEINRSGAARAALSSGVEALERKLGLPAITTKKGAKSKP